MEEHTWRTQAVLVVAVACSLFGYACHGSQTVIEGTGTLVACPPSEDIEYRMDLTEARRPADANERWGDYVLTPTPDGITYRDRLLSILVVAEDGVFSLWIENESDHSLQLIWDEAVYVGPQGYASRVFSGDATMIETRGVGTRQIPTIVPESARAAITAIPEALIYSYASNFAIHDFLYRFEKLEDLPGQKVQLLLPIRVMETVNEYTLVFTVLSAERERCTWFEGVGCVCG